MEAAQNTDREIWRETPDDAYSPSIHVTADGKIGISVGGYVFVKDIFEWATLAKKEQVWTVYRDEAIKSPGIEP